MCSLEFIICHDFHAIRAFGDGDNDIEFIEKAGLGIAMKNARETLKVVADEITEHTNVEDGAIRALQRLESEDKLLFTAN